MEITKDNFENVIKNEWIITNGIGGFASSTISNCNTRKYHGLLIAALGKSGERYLCLSKLNESIIFKNTEYSFSTNECINFIEKGYMYQTEFTKLYLPKFEYLIKNVKIEKEMAMKYGENKIAITYKIKTDKDDVILKLQPLVNFRSFHETKNFYEAPQDVNENAVNVTLKNNIKLHMKISDGEYTKYLSTYYENMYYKIEDERGLEAYESHYMPRIF